MADKTRRTTESKFLQKVDEFNRNADLIGDLSDRLEEAKRLDIILNEEVCLLLELLGYPLEYAEVADRIGDQIRASRSAA